MRGVAFRVGAGMAIVLTTLSIGSCDPGSFTVPATTEDPPEPATLHLEGIGDTVIEQDTALLTAVLLDQDGGAIADALISWSSSDPQILTVSSTGFSTADLTANEPGAATITASYETLSSSVNVQVHNRPVDLVHVSGSDQIAPAGTLLPDSLVVRAVDRRGDPVVDLYVDFVVTAGDGSVEPDRALTDAGGYAKASWTLGPGGEQSVQAHATAGQARVKQMKDSVVVFTGVVAAVLTALEVTPGEVTVDTGAVQTFQVLGLLSDGSEGAVPVAWSATGGTIDQGGAFTAGAQAGTFHVIASHEQGHADTAAVSVVASAATIARVIVSPPTDTLDAIGATIHLSATAEDSDGVDLSETSFTWTSLNAEVATVDATGSVVAVAVGSAMIVAAAAGLADTAVVAVRQVPISLAIDPAALTLSIGENAQLAAEVRDAGGTPIPGSPITWSSSAPELASISQQGVVTALDSGTAVITATSGGVTGQASSEINGPGETPPPATQGIWTSPSEIASLPMSGSAWEGVLGDAEGDLGTADIADQNSGHDLNTLAAALVCVRTGQHCAKARQGVLDAIGTEFNDQPGTSEPAAWLEVGRNLAGYVIAADILGLRADGDPNSDGTQVEEWIAGWLTREIPDNVSGTPRRFAPFHSGSNAASQEGFAFAAVAAYLGDQAALDRAWDAFRTFACDPGAPDHENIDLYRTVAHGWAHDDENPCAVNPAGTVKEVPAGLPGAGGTYRIDGAIGNDMRRGGDYQWEPVYTFYPWTGLAGFVPAAVILQRAGYPAFEVADRAVLRTHEYLWFLRTETGEFGWFDEDRGSEVVQLVNHYYGTAFPFESPVSRGHTIGYTDWTHGSK